MDQTLATGDASTEKSGEPHHCAQCGKFFFSSRSDEDANQESKELWGDMPFEEMCVVCDDCFRELVGDRSDEPKSTESE